MKKINIGCGSNPTVGWSNYDNSLSISLSKLPQAIINVCRKFKLLNDKQFNYIEFARKNDIKIIDASKKLPFNDGTLNAIYSSHMLEHLSKRTALNFLQECFRVLEKGGVLRISVPDFQILINDYNSNRDIEQFLKDSHLLISNDDGILKKLSSVVFGYRHHQYMYNDETLVKLLSKQGFKNVMVMPAGHTTIINPGALDLTERSGNSLYVEAKK